MSVLKRFYKNFGIQIPLEEEKRRFVQRINQSIFEWVEKSCPIPYEKVLWMICYELGLRFDDYWYVGMMDRIFHPLCKLTDNDFLKTLEVLISLYKFFDGKPNGQEEIISFWVKDALPLSTIDLGVKWKDGMFYKSGAKLLDEKLVEDPLDWLESYPLVKQNYLKGIDAYLNKRWNDVVDNCYLVIEGLAREVLQNSRTLDNNKDELLKKVNLSQTWKSILSNYINYANEYARHASDTQHLIKPQEVEAFLYFTGLLVRLIVESK